MRRLVCFSGFWALVIMSLGGLAPTPAQAAVACDASLVQSGECPDDAEIVKFGFGKGATLEPQALPLDAYASGAERIAVKLEPRSAFDGYRPLPLRGDDKTALWRNALWNWAGDTSASGVDMCVMGCAPQTLQQRQGAGTRLVPACAATQCAVDEVCEADGKTCTACEWVETDWDVDPATICPDQDATMGFSQSSASCALDPATKPVKTTPGTKTAGCAACEWLAGDWDADPATLCPDKTATRTVGESVPGCGADPATKPAETAPGTSTDPSCTACALPNGHVCKWEWRRASDEHWRGPHWSDPAYLTVRASLGEFCTTTTVTRKGTPKKSHKCCPDTGKPKDKEKGTRDCGVCPWQFGNLTPDPDTVCQYDETCRHPKKPNGCTPTAAKPAPRCEAGWKYCPVGCYWVVTGWTNGPPSTLCPHRSTSPTYGSDTPGCTPPMKKPSTAPVPGTKQNCAPCGWTAGEWRTAPSTLCERQTTTRTVTESPPGCGADPATKPATSTPGLVKTGTAACPDCKWVYRAWTSAELAKVGTTCRGDEVATRPIGVSPRGCTPADPRPASKLVGTKYCLPLCQCLSNGCATGRPTGGGSVQWPGSSLVSVWWTCSGAGCRDNPCGSQYSVTPPKPTKPTTPVTPKACEYSAWTPASSTKCPDETVAQTRTKTSGGSSCTDTSRTVSGTKSVGCGGSCSYSAWTPAASTKCSGVGFTQTRTKSPSSCSGATSQQATGTKTTGTCGGDPPTCNNCTYGSWSPAENSRCSGVSFQQTRTKSEPCCSGATSRQATGTGSGSAATWGAWSACVNRTKTRTCSPGTCGAKCSGPSSDTCGGDPPPPPCVYGPGGPAPHTVCQGQTYTWSKSATNQPCVGSDPATSTLTGTKRPTPGTWSAWSTCVNNTKTRTCSPGVCGGGCSGSSSAVCRTCTKATVSPGTCTASCSGGKCGIQSGTKTSTCTPGQGTGCDTSCSGKTSTASCSRDCGACPTIEYCCIDLYGGGPSVRAPGPGWTCTGTLIGPTPCSIR